MLMMFNSFIFVLMLLSFLYWSFFKFTTRFSTLKSTISSTLSNLFETPVANWLLFLLLLVFFLVNLTGNIPLNSIPTLFYSQTLTISLLFWVPLMICVSLSQIKEFLAHMLPYGSPLGLMLFLPLVEIFSQLIRPLTLMIRLSTNLSSGHIMMYMFSYFTLLSSVLAPFIDIVLSILFVLELCISMLQAYIFVSLLALYMNETV